MLLQFHPMVKDWGILTRNDRKGTEHKASIFYMRCDFAGAILILNLLFPVSLLRKHIIEGKSRETPGFSDEYSTLRDSKLPAEHSFLLLGQRCPTTADCYFQRLYIPRIIRVNGYFTGRASRC